MSGVLNRGNSRIWVLGWGVACAALSGVSAPFAEAARPPRRPGVLTNLAAAPKGHDDPCDAAGEDLDDAFSDAESFETFVGLPIRSEDLGDFGALRAFIAETPEVKALPVLTVGTISHAIRESQGVSAAWHDKLARELRLSQLARFEELLQEPDPRPEWILDAIEATLEAQATYEPTSARDPVPAEAASMQREIERLVAKAEALESAQGAAWREDASGGAAFWPDLFRMLSPPADFVADAHARLAARVLAQRSAFTPELRGDAWVEFLFDGAHAWIQHVSERDLRATSVQVAVMESILGILADREADDRILALPAAMDALAWITSRLARQQPDELELGRLLEDRLWGPLVSAWADELRDLSSGMERPTAEEARKKAAHLMRVLAGVRKPVAMLVGPTPGQAALIARVDRLSAWLYSEMQRLTLLASAEAAIDAPARRAD